jgi:hypothetical protein
MIFFSICMVVKDFLHFLEELSSIYNYSYPAVIMFGCSVGNSNHKYCNMYPLILKYIHTVSESLDLKYDFQPTIVSPKISNAVSLILTGSKIL